MVYDREMRALLKAVKASSRSPAEGIKRARQKMPDSLSFAEQGGSGRDQDVDQPEHGTG
jgi:hypothetical protein